MEAYAAVPPTAEKTALGEVRHDWADLSDDTDWDADWPEDR